MSEFTYFSEYTVFQDNLLFFFKEFVYLVLQKNCTFLLNNFLGILWSTFSVSWSSGTYMIMVSTFLTDPGVARDCSTNTFMNN